MQEGDFQNGKYTTFEAGGKLANILGHVINERLQESYQTMGKIDMVEAVKSTHHAVHQMAQCAQSGDRRLFREVALWLTAYALQSVLDLKIDENEKKPSLVMFDHNSGAAEEQSTTRLGPQVEKDTLEAIMRAMFGQSAPQKQEPKPNIPPDLLSQFNALLDQMNNDRRRGQQGPDDTINPRWQRGLF